MKFTIVFAGTQLCQAMNFFVSMTSYTNMVKVFKFNETSNFYMVVSDCMVFSMAGHSCYWLHLADNGCTVLQISSARLYMAGNGCPAIAHGCALLASVVRHCTLSPSVARRLQWLYMVVYGCVVLSTVVRCRQ